MTISVSVISHAFFTEKGASRALGSSREPGAVSQEELADQAEMKVEFVSVHRDESRHSLSPAATTAGAASREFPSTRTFAAASPSPRTAAAGGGKSQGKKRGNKKRGARGRQNAGGAEKEAKMMQIVLPAAAGGGAEVAGTASSSSSASVYNCGGGGVGGAVEAEVLMRDVREECSAALGIVKEDLELYALCHLPRSSDRARLLKDKSGVMHVGVMVRNSDLSLRSIEELVIRKDKAEQEAESYRLQASEKTQDFRDLKLKYDKLTEEVLRLRTMVNRANHLRRESEKATEILRVEFEKLVKSLFMDRSLQSPESTQHDDGEEA